MRPASMFSIGIISLVSVVGCAGQQPAVGTAGAGGPGAYGSGWRAQAGDTVYFVDHHVRPDQRGEFEEFVDQILWPALERQERVRVQTRLLKSEVPDENGFFTYTFVLDPVVPGERYNVLDFLRATYPAEEAFQHYVRFTEMWGREFTTRRFVQTR
jgi:hypothetical protein